MMRWKNIGVCFVFISVGVTQFSNTMLKLETYEQTQPTGYYV